MRNLSSFLLLGFLISCADTSKTNEGPGKDHDNLSKVFEKYYQERIQLMPLEGTQNGDTVANDKLYPDFTDSYRARLKEFFSDYLAQINKFNRDELNDNDRIGYDIFKREMEINIDGINLGYFGSTVSYPLYRLIPFHQFGGMPLTLGQLGSGEGSQPFKTVRDYDNWLKRAGSFKSWADSAIVYFKKGIEANQVLPVMLVKKMVPQMEAMVVKDATKSLFYGPVNKFPADFNTEEKQRLTASFIQLINEQLVPSYKRLAEFLKNEYQPKARNTTGICALPKGDITYNYLIRSWTTTNKTPEEIYQTGLAEVKRIRGEMERTKNEVGFKGDLKAFFEYMRTDPKFKPFKSPAEVLNAFHAIHKRMEPNLKIMFSNTPKAKFEIRQTEAFRAASASAQYSPGTPDGTRARHFLCTDSGRYQV